MRITLQPTVSSPRSLIGLLDVVGSDFSCYFLTLPLGDGLPGSAIPPGTYSVVLSPSPHFEALALKDPWFAPYAARMPHLQGIPGRSLIMIHPGNVPAQTDGCILTGGTRGPDYIGESRTEFAALYPMIVAAVDNPTEACFLDMLPLAA